MKVKALVFQFIIAGIVWCLIWESCSPIHFTILQAPILFVRTFTLYYLFFLFFGQG